MANKVYLTCQFQLMGSGSANLEGCVERDLEVMSGSAKKKKSLID